MNHKTDADKPDTDRADCPPTLSSDPDRELELKLKKNPQDPDLKADVGSDESMDASDPSSATQPGGNEPAPSSSFPEGERGRRSIGDTLVAEMRHNRAMLGEVKNSDLPRTYPFDSI